MRRGNAGGLVSQIAGYKCDSCGNVSMKRDVRGWIDMRAYISVSGVHRITDVPRDFCSAKCLMDFLRARVDVDSEQ